MNIQFFIKVPKTNLLKIISWFNFVNNITKCHFTKVAYNIKLIDYINNKYIFILFMTYLAYLQQLI
jgi:hypothetical protein